MLYLLILLSASLLSAMDDLCPDSPTEKTYCMVKRSPGCPDLHKAVREQIKTQIFSAAIAGNTTKIDEILNRHNFIDLRLVIIDCLAAIEEYFNSIDPYSDKRKPDFYIVHNLLHKHLKENNFIKYITYE